MGGTEGLSLDSGNSRILWDDHIVTAVVCFRRQELAWGT
jgi:hypothetical protein